MAVNEVEQAIDGLVEPLREALLVSTTRPYAQCAAELGTTPEVLVARVREAQERVSRELLGEEWRDSETRRAAMLVVDHAALRMQRKREARWWQTAAWVQAAVAIRLVPVWPRGVGAVCAVGVVCVVAYVGMSRSADGRDESVDTGFRSFVNVRDEEPSVGEAVAQFELGRLYATGAEGVGRDYREAADWFRRAADQGHAGAQFELGRLYANGAGVDRDEQEAVEWLRSAADQGHPEAQLELRKLTGPR